uniref:Uncharacterized protein n=1 Tax=Nelumbo nucifera TaxID=4432 RepID=A0A822ZFA3_NELNU|nr:TPA_asm: hypothetical protein HUJ06_016009 [Nelumbo nucifera]
METKHFMLMLTLQKDILDSVCFVETGFSLRLAASAT